MEGCGYWPGKRTGVRKSTSLIGLALWLAVCVMTAWFGARFTPGAWYAALAKPAWTPPAWIFGPVWTLLYILMALAAWLVWRQRGFTEAGLELSLFLVQLLVNGLWSWFFFGLQRPGWALWDLTLLWLLVGLTLGAFWRIRLLPGLLLTPYFLWVSFALALNFTLWRLNPP